LTAIEKDIGSIKDSLKTLAPLLRETTIRRINEAENLTPKELSAQLSDLKSLAKTAQAENVPIKPETVEKVGKKLIEVGGADAWDTALAFVHYNSFLNTSLVPDLSSITPIEPTQQFSWYDYNSPIGHQGQLYRIGIATSDFPQLRLIEHPDKNAGQNVGPEFLLIKNAEILLDDTYMKKVIIQDSRIVYKGGPVKLHNVLFVNCQFDVQPTSQGKEFANSALSHTPITFTSS